MTSLKLKRTNSNVASASPSSQNIGLCAHNTKRGEGDSAPTRSITNTTLQASPDSKEYCAVSQPSKANGRVRPGILPSRNITERKEKKRITARLETERKGLENRLRRVEGPKPGPNPVLSDEETSRRSTKKRLASSFSKDSGVGADASRTHRVSLASILPGSKLPKSQSSFMNENHRVTSHNNSANFYKHPQAVFPSDSPRYYGDAAMPRGRPHQGASMQLSYTPPNQAKEFLQSPAMVPGRPEDKRYSQMAKRNNTHPRHEKNDFQHGLISEQGSQVNAKNGYQKKSTNTNGLKPSSNLNRFSSPASSQSEKRDLIKGPVTSTTSNKRHSSPTVSEQSKTQTKPLAASQSKSSVKLEPQASAFRSDEQKNVKFSPNSFPTLQKQRAPPKMPPNKRRSNRSSPDGSTVFKSSPLAAAPAISGSTDVLKNATAPPTIREPGSAAQRLPSKVPNAENSFALRSKAAEPVSSQGRYKGGKSGALGQEPPTHPAHAKDEQRKVDEDICSHASKAKKDERRDLPSPIADPNSTAELAVMQSRLKDNRSQANKPEAPHSSPIHAPSILGSEINSVSDNEPRRFSGSKSREPMQSLVLDVPDESSSACSGHESPHEEEYETAPEDAPSTTASRETLSSTVYSDRPRPTTQLSRSVDENGLALGSSGIPGSATNGPAEVQTGGPELNQNVRQLQQGQLLAKTFTVCCRCKTWHDIFSETYGQMESASGSSGNPVSNPFPPEKRTVQCSCNEFSEGRDSSDPKEQFGQTSSSPCTSSSEARRADGAAIPEQFRPIRASESRQCSLCAHRISMVCCQSWSTAVRLRNRRD